MERLKIIGSSHISKDSIRQVRHEIKFYSPDIVAMELDNKRAYALMQKEQKPDYWMILKRIGFKGLLFTALGAWAQKKLGKIVGVSPGAEMKEALILAKKNEKRIALIDQDIEVTLKRLSKAITWREKYQFVKDLVGAFIFRKKPKFDIRKVPTQKVIDEMIKEVKEKYPSIYRVLIDERNKVMAKRLFILLRNNPNSKILAIVGAGHKEEMLKLISKYEQEN